MQDRIMGIYGYGGRYLSIKTAVNKVDSLMVIYYSANAVYQAFGCFSNERTSMLREIVFFLSVVMGFN